MPAHAQTPDLSLPPLPDLSAGLDIPALPNASDPMPASASSAAIVNAPAATAPSTPADAKPGLDTRADASSIDDLLPAQTPKTETAAPTTLATAGDVTTPGIAASDNLPLPTSSTPTTADAPPELPALPETPLAEVDNDAPLTPPSLAEEAAAKGVTPPLIGLPPMPATTAQALLTGQPLGSDVEEAPETPLVKVVRKRSIRDLPRLKPVIVPLRHTYNYQRQVLPPSIYKTAYSPENRHLPKAASQRMHDRHLFGAVAANDVNVTRAFLDRGKSVNMVNANGETLLMTAVRYGALDTMRLLLARGADPRLSGSNGMTALQLAESSGQQTMAEVLRARGA